ncbi:hypothetical protein PBAC_17160 [Pedobacter glucosidilyticus]|nr:outer membrane beta-barrel protein [Pedobacter glucosidilyticus]KHJ38175.1 hypothetical protein PBAC_17160 [Pedobacter glucosidilyticus]
MKKIVLMFFMLVAVCSHAQDKPKSYQKWIITVGGNMINDDSGKDGHSSRYLKNYFSPKSWDLSMVNIGLDYRLNKLLYLNSTFTANKVDIRTSSGAYQKQTFVMADVNLKLRLDTVTTRKTKLEPYIIVGFGYTNSTINHANFNAGIGSYYWINKNVV